ncbi:MAG TPA: thiamine phosphate synthase [Myxococcales bacterium]
MLPHGVYAIVDGSAGKPPLELVGAFVRGGAAVVQLRLKDIGAGEFLRVAREARKLTAGKALLLINDRPDVAKLAEADGVHLGQDDLPVEAARAILGPKALIGLSTHSDAEIDGALAAGVDYIGFGPVFATRSKGDAPLPPPHGIRGLYAAVKRAGKTPVVAIGGITAASSQHLAWWGVRGVAAIAELCNAPSPEQRTREMVEAFGYPQ